MDIPQASAFRRLHQSGCFVIPNPWDVGSARALQRLGFKALATTSAGFGFSPGVPDSPTALPLDTVLDHISTIVGATDLPVNADFQTGYASSAEGVEENVRRCVATGVAGLSIEDATGDPERPLFELPEAVERVAAARAAIDDSGRDVLLTARAECFLTGHPRALDEAVSRLRAYSEAGADVLYAPGPTSESDIGELVACAHPKPLNFLMHRETGLMVDDIAALGVRRISLGSALARVVWGAFIRAAAMIHDKGSFAGLDRIISFAELNALFQDEAGPR